jgi:uncharacterized membrane protein YfcA
MEHVSLWLLALYSIVCFGSSILSGIAGGGAGFITTPFLILLGLTPAQAIATGKVTGLSVSAASLTGLRGVAPTSKKLLISIMTLAFVIGIGAPLVITNLDSDTYRRILGVLLLAMIPVLLFKKIGHATHHPSRAKEIAGYALLAVTLGMQAVFSAGMGTLVNVVLMAFLGMNALEANITKRYSQVILNAVIVLGVLGSGLIVWQIAIAGVISGAAGGYIGGKIAVKKGNRFAVSVFVGLMFVSALALLFG